MDKIKKYSWIIWLGIAFILFCLLRKYLFKNDHNKAIDALEMQTDKCKDEIKKIDKRIEKRKKLYKAVKEKKIETDKKISRMSDDELDRYINAYL